MLIEDVIRQLDREVFRDLEGPEARALFAEMAKAVHPDVCRDPRAGEVFSRLVRARDASIEEVAPHGAEIVLKTAAGRRFSFRTLSDAVSDAGRIMILRRSLTEVFTPENDDLADRALSAVKAFRFADTAMRLEMSRFLPREPSVRRLDDGSVMIITPRQPGDALLRDVVARRGPLDPRTGAWIISGLMNVACWLAWSGTQHGAVSEDSVMIDPQTHRVSLNGGWAFSAKIGKTMTALPARTLSVIPALGEPGAVAAPDTDRVLIRRLLLRLCEPGSLPEPVRLWARSIAGDDAVLDYRSWRSAMTQAWGKPVFHDAGFTATDVYGKAA